MVNCYCSKTLQATILHYQVKLMEIAVSIFIRSLQRYVKEIGGASKLMDTFSKTA